MSGFRRPHLKPTRRSPPPQRASQRHRGRHTPASVRNSPHGIFHVEHPTPRLHHPGLAWASSVELGVRRPRRASDAHLRSPHPETPETHPDTLEGRHNAIVAATPSGRTPPRSEVPRGTPDARPPLHPGGLLGLQASTSGVTRPRRTSGPHHSNPHVEPRSAAGRRDAIMAVRPTVTANSPMEVPRGTGWAGDAGDY